jgi:hypothetical protein
MTKLSPCQLRQLRVIAQEFKRTGQPVYVRTYIYSHRRMASSKTAAALYRAGVVEHVGGACVVLTDKGRQVLEEHAP